MRYLADATALVGFYLGRGDFPHRVRSILEDEAEATHVAAVTVWEIAIKTELGKLPSIVPDGMPGLAAMLRDHGFRLIAFDAETAEQAASLPPLHRDPFDRALVATAQRTGAVVLTNESAIAAYGVPCLWVGE